MAHTPGPWTVSSDDKLNPDRAFGIVTSIGFPLGKEEGERTEVIAEVCEGSTAKADAHLIAAAPEMLALLRECLTDTESACSNAWGDEHPASPDDCQFCCTRQRIQEVLALATHPQEPR